MTSKKIRKHQGYNPVQLISAPCLLLVTHWLRQTTPQSSNIVGSYYIKLMNVYSELTSESMSFHF